MPSKGSSRSASVWVSSGPVRASTRASASRSAGGGAMSVRTMRSMRWPSRVPRASRARARRAPTKPPPPVIISFISVSFSALLVDRVRVRGARRVRRAAAWRRRPSMMPPSTSRCSPRIRCSLACCRAATGSWAAIASKMARCSLWTAVMKSARRASLPRVMRMPSRRYCSRKPSSSRNCGLPVDSPITRWKARSSATPSRPSATAVSMASRARRSAAIWLRVARSAASAAISPSRTRRTSTTCTTACTEVSTAGSKASAWFTGGGATNTPEPWRDCTSALDLSWWTASRTTVRETPWAVASCCSVGSRSPAFSAPLSICAPSSAANRSDSRSTTSGWGWGEAEIRTAEDEEKAVIRSSYKYCAG